LFGFVRLVVALVDCEGRRVIVVGGDIVDSGVAGQLVANKEGESIL
jgi:hypothetical protein